MLLGGMTAAVTEHNTPFSLSMEANFGEGGRSDDGVDDNAAMAAMGLPTTFSNVRRAGGGRKRGGGEQQDADGVADSEPVGNDGDDRGVSSAASKKRQRQKQNKATAKAKEIVYVLFRRIHGAGSWRS